MKVLILGAGAGGAAAVAQLTLAGHEVTLWNRSTETLAPLQQIGGVAFKGVLGEGVARLAKMTTDLRDARDGVDAAVVMLPTFAHAGVARSMIEADWPGDVPVILNPGHTGGALEFSHTYVSAGCSLPPIAEFSTLTYVARKYQPDTVNISGCAKKVRVAPLPDGDPALEAAAALFPCADPAPDILFSGLSNVNMVLHPPGAILAAAWVEASGGEFTFYVAAMTPGVERVMRELDGERRAVGGAFGHGLPSLIAEMQRIGTVEEGFCRDDDFAAAISGGVANSRIKAPDSLKHRYYLEDFGHGLVPFLALAEIANVDVPVSSSLLRIAEALTGADYRADGRTAARMGVAGLTRDELLTKVRAS